MHLLSSPRFKHRRSVRYPVHLPVLAKLPGASLPIVGRSENISLHGMLFFSDYLIIERSAVEFTIDLGGAPQRPASLTARGKVLRVQPQPTGNFAIAVAFDHPIAIKHISAAGPVA
jgi:hypothetical protein